MVDQAYQTIVGQSEGFYKEKGSKFISYAYPIDSLESIKSKISHLKKQYHDARHHCYAYVLRENGTLATRANDDGEPGHSAGDPILGQIKSYQIENVLVVVVRYFGGTKLGVSGLIQAYKTAAQEALAKTKVIKVVIKKEISIAYPYDKTNEVMRLVNNLGIEIVQQVFEESCLIRANILPSKLNELERNLELLDGVILSII